MAEELLVASGSFFWVPLFCKSSSVAMDGSWWPFWSEFAPALVALDFLGGIVVVFRIGRRFGYHITDFRKEWLKLVRFSSSKVEMCLLFITYGMMMISLRRCLLQNPCPFLKLNPPYTCISPVRQSLFSRAHPRSHRCRPSVCGSISKSMAIGTCLLLARTPWRRFCCETFSVISQLAVCTTLPRCQHITRGTFRAPLRVVYHLFSPTESQVKCNAVSNVLAKMKINIVFSRGQVLESEI